MNGLLAVLVSCFDTERLGNQADLRRATCCILRGSSQAAKNVWLPDQGLNFVWSETVSQFPLEMVALLELSRAVAHSSKENKFRVLSGFCIKLVMRTNLDHFYFRSVKKSSNFLISWNRLKTSQNLG